MFLQREVMDPSGWLLAYFFYAGNTSYWNNNDAAILGRVRPEHLTDSNLDNWLFFCGSPEEGKELWCREEADAIPVLSYKSMLGENMVGSHLACFIIRHTNHLLPRPQPLRSTFWIADKDS